jgi:hypothetical protein
MAQRHTVYLKRTSSGRAQWQQHWYHARWGHEGPDCWRRGLGPVSVALGGERRPLPSCQ